MGDEKNPIKDLPNNETKPEDKPIAGPGVDSLLRGKRSEENVFAAKAVEEERASARPIIPSWYFFAADILLIAFALIVVYKSPGPLDAKQTIFCVVSIALAATLGVLGILVGRKGR